MTATADTYTSGNGFMPTRMQEREEWDDFSCKGGLRTFFLKKAYLHRNKAMSP